MTGIFGARCASWTVISPAEKKKKKNRNILDVSVKGPNGSNGILLEANQ